MLWAVADRGRLSPRPLPEPRTSFIGRKRELGELGNALRRSRLITLTGSAGCGKTRLALQAARAAVEDYEAVAFLDLTPVRDSIGIQETMTAALGIRQRDMRSLLTDIEGIRLLIVIDNAEHVIDAVCGVIDDILRLCPRTSMLVTSRELLDMDGEVRCRVEPLRAPEPDTTGDLAALAAHDAIQLFCERAREHLPGFQLVPANAELVATICKRLEGIPLALELAAARVRAFALQDIVARLDDLLSLLSQGRRIALPRHRTMQAAIDWSYELLSGRERVLLPRLAIFANTFDLEAVEAICSDSDVQGGAVPDVLRQLADKSLVIPHRQPDGALRYGQLEVLRQYGLRRLPSDCRPVLVERYVRYYAELVHRMTSTDEAPRVRSHMIDLNYSNVQQALDESLATNPDMALDMIEDLQWWWLLRGEASQARRRIECILADNRIDKHRLVRTYASAHTWSCVAGDRQAASRYADQAVSLARGGADVSLELWVRNLLGMTSAQHNDWLSSEQHFLDAIELCERATPDAFTNRADLWGRGLPPTRSRMLAMSRNNLAHLLFLTGRLEEALTASEGALAAMSDVEIPTLAPWLLATHGQVLLLLKRPAEATASFTRALEQVVAHGADSLAVSLLTGLSCTAADRGAFAACVTLVAAAHGAAQRSGATPEQVLPVAQAEAHSRSQLGEGPSQAAWRRGLRMSLVDSLSLARTMVDRTPSARSALTPRQTEIVRLVSQGLSDKQIAKKLRISARTVEVHLAHTRKVLGVHNRAQIAVWFVTTGGGESPPDTAAGRQT
jgi:non-specific serine/threonine protein kinase